MNFFNNRNYRNDIMAYKEYIEKYYDDTNAINDKMSELYRFMKEIAPSYADSNRFINNDYRYLLISLCQIEQNLPLHYILKNQPDFDFNREYLKVTDEDIKDKSAKEILEYIVYRGRCFIAAALSQNGDEASIDLGKVDLYKKCKESSDNVRFICDCLKLISHNNVIAPAFYRLENVYEYGNNHWFTLVEIGNKKYIIDLTYSQFFQTRINNFNRIGIPLTGGCGAGSYMTLTEERKKFAEALMRDGYFEATEKNLKLYFDGFAMSFRNGLYYEDMDNIIYETSYTGTDYLNFIAGIDSQLNHEKREHLGRQRKILKNPDMSFQPHK